MTPDKNDSYDIYKPLRNHLRQFHLVTSLSVVRAYVQFMQFGKDMPRDIQVDGSFLRAANRIEAGVYEWDLELLAKELILNAEQSPITKSLKLWPHFSDTLNKIKDVCNRISARYKAFIKDKDDVLMQLYRISHQQFHWQEKPNLIYLTRYYKIFSQPKIDEIIQKNIGLTAKELYTIGLVMTGAYIDNFAVFYPPDLQVAGITQEKFDKFLKHFCTDIDSLKKAIGESQQHNQNYEYTLNPLRFKPLIKIIYKDRESLICPIPTLLFRRFTEGVYYEICKDADFSNPFGESFQKYIGEVCEMANRAKKYEVIGETEYHVGRDRKNSTDWIATDGTANLFIECKTKRLRALAKVELVDSTILNEELDHMADFVVQTYKSISDFRANHYPQLKDNGLKTYPLIVTLEDWHALGEKIIGEIDGRVKTKLAEQGMDVSLTDDVPYTICSAQSLEGVMQIIDMTSIESFMASKVQGEHRLWPMRSFIFDKYKEEAKKLSDLFPDDFKDIHPAIDGIKGDSR